MISTQLVHYIYLYTMLSFSDGCLIKIFDTHRGATESVEIKMTFVIYCKNNFRLFVLI